MTPPKTELISKTPKISSAKLNVPIPSVHRIGKTLSSLLIFLTLVMKTQPKGENK